MTSAPSFLASPLGAGARNLHSCWDSGRPVCGMLARCTGTANSRPRAQGAWGPTMALTKQAQVLPLGGASLFGALGAGRPLEATWSNPFVLLMGKLRRGRKAACPGIQQSQVPGPGVLTPSPASPTCRERAGLDALRPHKRSLALCFLRELHSAVSQGVMRGEQVSRLQAPTGTAAGGGWESRKSS